MNEKGKVELLNTILQVLGTISVFFAGYILESLFALAVFLFVGGIIVLQVKIVSLGEEEKNVPEQK